MILKKKHFIKKCIVYSNIKAIMVSFFQDLIFFIKKYKEVTHTSVKIFF